ncbi:NAD-dependent epimerase/dehydratase family protein [Streptomyces aquilus]|uniref:NAD-dependent epimerase/dehydratase family protein n=1 Tax=Streptomyces aquilus TaxID=2548456 RepID=UPI0036A217F9
MNTSSTEKTRPAPLSVTSPPRSHEAGRPAGRRRAPDTPRMTEIAHRTGLPVPTALRTLSARPDRHFAPRPGTWRPRGHHRPLPRHGLAPDQRQPTAPARHLVPQDPPRRQPGPPADRGWADALDGVGHVLHHASPFPVTPPEAEDDIIRPARDGALRVLTAARKAGVGRVVMTSSYAAVGYTAKPGNAYSEEDWTDPDTEGLPAYHKSKVLAERAAWDYPPVSWPRWRRPICGRPEPEGSSSSPVVT